MASYTQLRATIDTDPAEREALFQHHWFTGGFRGMSEPDARRYFESNMVGNTRTAEVWTRAYLPDYNRLHPTPAPAPAAPGGPILKPRRNVTFGPTTIGTRTLGPYTLDGRLISAASVTAAVGLTGLVLESVAGQAGRGTASNSLGAIGHAAAYTSPLWGFISGYINNARVKKAAQVGADTLATGIATYLIGDKINDTNILLTGGKIYLKGAGELFMVGSPIVAAMRYLRG